jgi:hypothetical protein
LAVTILYFIPGYYILELMGRESDIGTRFLLSVIILPVKVIRKSGYNTYRGWTQTGYLNKHYNINQKDEDT